MSLEDFLLGGLLIPFIASKGLLLHKNCSYYRITELVYDIIYIFNNFFLLKCT